MARTEDPLKCLRVCMINGLNMYENDEYVILDRLAFQKSSKTKFTMWNKRNEYYTLEALYFFVKNRSLVHKDYAERAAAHRMQIITRPDRIPLLNYLTNKSSDKLPDGVDEAAPLCAAITIEELQVEQRKRQIERNRKRRLQRLLEKSSVVQNDPKFNQPARDLSKELGLTASKVAALRSQVLTRKKTRILRTKDESDSDESASACASCNDNQQEMLAREIVYTSEETILEASEDLGAFTFPILTRLGLNQDEEEEGNNDTRKAMEALLEAGKAAKFRVDEEDDSEGEV